MKSSNRLAWIGGITVLAILLLTLISAPTVNKINSGSTYGRGASGYGAWYAYMQKQGISIKRWQKPFPAVMGEKNPVTFIRINSDLKSSRISRLEKKFVAKGNTLVILGVREPVRTTNFSTIQDSKFGNIKIDTGRRKEILDTKQSKLGDNFGAVVWEKKYEKGKVVLATTPDLAANAYQENLANYRYLKDLVTKDGKPLLIDEYIHGYVDKNPNTPGKTYRDSKESLWGYLSKTPLAIAFIQAGILLFVLVLSQNKFMGQAKSVTTPIIDNSKAYIQALSAVLHRAESHSFVAKTIASYEHRELQKALGIIATSDSSNMSTNISRDLQEKILSAWNNQIGTVPQELISVLNIHERKRNWSEKDLMDWLGNWQKVKEILSSKKLKE
ncbi:MAG: DUF4350 domain-containing protein [Cyanobacteria bacterium P01_A01_bin.45]